MGSRVLPPLTTRGLSVAGWCLPPLVTYERMFRNRVHVTRCTRRAVTLFRLEEPPPGTAPRRLQTRAGSGAALATTVATTVAWPAQFSLQHSSSTPVTLLTAEGFETRTSFVNTRNIGLQLRKVRRWWTSLWAASLDGLFTKRQSCDSETKKSPVPEWRKPKT